MAGPKFATQLETWGNRCALIDENASKVTYAELAALADEFGARLGNRTELAAIDGRRRIEAIVAYLGVLRRGLPALIFEAGPKAEEILRVFRPDAEFRFDDTSNAFKLRFSESRLGPTPHPDLSLLLSTSGSTGGAKLVRLSAANLESNADSIVEYLGIGADDVALTTLPLFYSYGLSVLHSHLNAGATIVVTEVSANDSALVKLAADFGVTSIAGVPSTYELMDRSGTLRALPPSVRTLTQAGGRMATEMVRHIAAVADTKGARLFVMYGQTEATARIAYLPPELLDRHADCIGGAIPGGRLEVANPETGAPVQSVGELVYTGPNVMMGYAYSREDLARSKEVTSLKTGDLGREVAPGLFRIEGRLSRFIKPLGLRIGLDELEAIARSSGGQVYVAGDDSGAVVVATDELHVARAKSALGRLGLPADLFVYLVRNPVPFLSNGKPDYASLLRSARAAVPSGERTKEAKIRGAFDELAGRAADGSSTFNSLAGDSLSYINTSLSIEDALGYLPENWERLTLNALIRLARAPERGDNQGDWPKFEIAMLLRAAAITLVILDHAIGGLQGGADVLLLLSGISWGRFQRTRLLYENPLAVFARSMGRFLIIYFIIVLAYSAFKKHLFINHLLMISTFLADWGGQLNVYWFIESLAWCTAFTCLLFSSGAIREFASRRPVLSGASFLALALAIRFTGEAFYSAQTDVMRTPDQLLVYFAGGWLIALSDRSVRVLAGAVLTLVSISAWGLTNSHSIIMLGCCLMLAAAPSVRLPPGVAQVARILARYSFYIYLTCAIPLYISDYVLRGGPYQHLYWILHLALAFGLGIGLGIAMDRLTYWRTPTLAFRSGTFWFDRSRI